MSSTAVVTVKYRRNFIWRYVVEVVKLSPEVIASRVDSWMNVPGRRGIMLELQEEAKLVGGMAHIFKIEKVGALLAELLVSGYLPFEGVQEWEPKLLAMAILSSMDALNLELSIVNKFGFDLKDKKRLNNFWYLTMPEIIRALVAKEEDAAQALAVYSENMTLLL